MDKRYAIFDMDGTLLDSMSFWRGLPQEFLSRIGDYTITRAQADRIAGMTLPQAVEFLIAEYQLPQSPEHLMDVFTRMIEEHYRRDLQLKPGVRAYLEQLHTAGVKLCIASATAQPLIEVCFERLGIRPLFEFILSCQELHTDKHHPEIYQLAARKLGAQPEETAVFEDVLYALQTAAGAGFYTVGVYDDASAELWLQIEAAANETMHFV